MAVQKMVAGLVMGDGSVRETKIGWVPMATDPASEASRREIEKSVAGVFVDAPPRFEPKSGDIWNRPLKDPDYDANQKARQAVFVKITPKGNWKDPIDAWVDEADLRDCEEAAIFFCGSILDVVERKDGKVRVVGAGYYACIGS